MEWEQMLSFTSLNLEVNASNITNINLKYSTNDRLNTNLYKRRKQLYKSNFDIQKAAYTE